MRYIASFALMMFFAVTPAWAALPTLSDPACQEAVPEDNLRTATLVSRAGFRVIEGTLEREGLSHIKAQSLGDVLVAFTTDRFGPAGHCGYYNRGLFYEISGASYTDESGISRIGHYRDGVQFIHPASHLSATHKLWAHKGTSVGKVVFLPSPIGKCDRDLGECKEAWQIEQSRADNLAVASAAKDKELNCWRLGRVWKDKQCVDRISAASAQTAVSSATEGSRQGQPEGARLGQARARETESAVSNTIHGREGMAWILALILGILFVIVLIERKVTPAVEDFQEELRDEPEVNKLRTRVQELSAERNSLRETLAAIIAKLSEITQLQVARHTIVADVQGLVAKLQRAQTERGQRELERDAAREDNRAKQVALEAAEARNAELAELLRGRELKAPVQPAVDLTPFAAQATALLRRRDVEPESNGERDAHELAAAVLGQLVSEAGKVWDERDGLERDLDDARRGRQEAGVELEHVRGELAEAEAELAAFREEVSAGDADANPPAKADRDDAQDAEILALKQEIRELKQQGRGMGEALTTKLDPIGEFIDHPRRVTLQRAAKEAYACLRAAARLASPAN